MMVCYQCYGRSHTSIVAAHLHLGRLPRDGSIPTVKQFMDLPYFDQGRNHDFGQPLHMGYDEDGHEICALGFGADQREGLGVIYSLYRLIGRREPLIVGTLSGLGILARGGGFLSRQAGLVSLGRPLVAFGIKQIYPKLVLTVDSVRRFLKEVAE